MNKFCTNHTVTTFEIGSVNYFYHMAVIQSRQPWKARAFTWREIAFFLERVVHQMSTVNLMKTLQANTPNPQLISWSGKCICFVCSRFSMFSFGVAHLPIVSTMLVQMKKIALRQELNNFAWCSPPKCIEQCSIIRFARYLSIACQQLGGTPQDHERRSTPKYEVVSYQDNLVHDTPWYYDWL